MSNPISLPALLCLSIALTSCGSRFVGIDPALTQEQRDQVQRSAARPPMAPSDSYEVVTVQSDVVVPLNRFLAWFTDTGAPQFASFLTGTAAIAGAIRSDQLIGSWREVGDRRRITFADGSSALEEITVDQKQHLFQYEMWNLTNDTGRYITYAVSEFSFSEIGKSTQIRWTYSFRPLAWPDGWFIRRVVQEDYRQFMEKALSAMRDRALSDLARP